MIFMTVVVGDMAAIFGCLITLENSITAITFVALGKLQLPKLTVAYGNLWHCRRITLL